MTGLLPVGFSSKCHKPFQRSFLPPLAWLLPYQCQIGCKMGKICGGYSDVVDKGMITDAVVEFTKLIMTPSDAYKSPDNASWA